jgi:Uma2 family endonuclease
MATVGEQLPAVAEELVEPLAAGDRRSREEFMRLWEAHPNIKRAELIGGTVYMPSPLKVNHGEKESKAGTWLGVYSAHTPGTESAHNTTSFILEDTPQPDVNLRILPEYGGGSWIERGYLAGRPELLTEVCGSSAAYDLHQKFDLYEAAKIPEYVAILLYEREIRWHVLVDNVYQLLPPDADKIWRSRIFPGLWLDGAALLAGDMARVLAKLDEGLRSPEHQAFVEKLAKARKP